VIRSTWDYHHKHRDFLAWAAAVPRLYNRPSLVRWNTDKRYLLELGERVPTVPSVALSDPSPQDVRVRLREHGWSDGVLKPAVGLDGHGVVRVPGDRADGGWKGTWLLQPFLRGVVEEGEISVVVIEGRPSHAVVRQPPEGDFRSQERLGGRVRPTEPDAGTVELAVAATEWIDPVPLYARVDIVRGEGGPRVMELELTEPSLFLGSSPHGLATMVEAVRRLTE
jgi:glutathione synthase/RimK-type ligase-like ATP-grasp enzyme